MWGSTARRPRRLREEKRGREVGVSLRHRDRLVTHELAHRLEAPRLAPRPHHEVARARVPEVVKPHLAVDPGLVPLPSNEPLDPVAALELVVPPRRVAGPVLAPARAREHEPRRRAGELLPLPKGLVRARQERAPTHRAALRRPAHAAPHGEPRARVVEVDVVPPKREELAAPHAGEDRDGEEQPIAVVERRARRHPLDLVEGEMRPRLLERRLTLRELRELRRVRLDELAGEGVVEGLSKKTQGVLHRLTREGPIGLDRLAAPPGPLPGLRAEPLRDPVLHVVGADRLEWPVGEGRGENVRRPRDALDVDPAHAVELAPREPLLAPRAHRQGSRVGDPRFGDLGAVRREHLRGTLKCRSRVQGLLPTVCCPHADPVLASRLLDPAFHHRLCAT